jgi:DNA polymerase III delta subunit
MTDYLGKRKFDKALEIIGEMLSKGEPHARIVTSLYNYFRRLLHAAISGKTAADLSVAFGVKEFAARKTQEQAAMFKKRALKNAVDFLIDVDYKTKSGQLSADEGMWIALFRIITEK